MPKIVDHDARRAELLAAVSRVVRRRGLEGATIREIAREAGCSSGVLAHYFRDKDDILRSACDLAVARIEERIGRIRARLGGIVALREVLLELLPVDAARARGVHIEICTWSQVLCTDRARREHARWFDARRQILVDLLEEALRRGEVRADLDVTGAGVALLSMADGLAANALMHPDRVTRERQRQTVDIALLAIALPPS